MRGYDNEGNSCCLWCYTRQCQDDDMHSQKAIDGNIKYKEEKEMTDLNDQTKRLELVHRYLNAETTLDEEQLLQDYYPLKKRI